MVLNLFVPGSLVSGDFSCAFALFFSDFSESVPCVGVVFQLALGSICQSRREGRRVLPRFAPGKNFKFFLTIFGRAMVPRLGWEPVWFFTPRVNPMSQTYVVRQMPSVEEQTGKQGAKGAPRHRC